MAGPYVSNLTTKFKNLKVSKDKPNDDEADRYKNYIVDEDTNYASNNQIERINTHLKEEVDKETADVVTPPMSKPIPNAESKNIPLADLHPEMFSIPAYSQTPIQTPIQTPSVTSSFVGNQKSVSGTEAVGALTNSYGSGTALRNQSGSRLSSLSKIKKSPAANDESYESLSENLKPLKTLQETSNTPKKSLLTKKINEQKQQENDDQKEADTHSDTAADAKPENVTESSLADHANNSNNDTSLDNSEKDDIAYITERKNGSKFKEKRLSALSFAKNIISLSVYHDSDYESDSIDQSYSKLRVSEKAPLLNNNVPSIPTSKTDKPDTTQNIEKKSQKTKKNRHSFSLGKGKSKTNSKRASSSISKASDQAAAQNNDKDLQFDYAEKYHNVNLPTKFSEFVDKFILPNCDVLTSFPVLEQEEIISTQVLENDSINSSMVYSAANDSSDQIITNGIHPDKNVGALKRSASFLKKGSSLNLTRKFSTKKSKSSSNIIKDSERKSASINRALLEEKIDVNDKKYIKQIFKLETEDLIKILKYWNYDYTMPDSKELFPYLHNLELNVNQYNFFKHELNSNTDSPQARSLDDSDMHKQDYKISGSNRDSLIGPPGAAAANHLVNEGDLQSNLSKLIPLPNSDKYLLIINTNDMYECDDSKDIDDGEIFEESEQVDLKNLVNYIKKKYYLKGSINPWEILDYDTFDGSEAIQSEEALKNNKKRDIKVRFHIDDNGEQQEESSDLESGFSASDEYSDTHKNHRFIKLSDEELLVNDKKFNGYSKPLNSLKRMNRIKNSDQLEGKQHLAHNLYNKKINLRNYNFQNLLLFKISHIILYNNDNNVGECLKFAKIFGLLQKKIYLQEEMKLKSFGENGEKFKESACFIVNYECAKVSEFDINYYNENENVLLGIKEETKFESVKKDGLNKISDMTTLIKYVNGNPFLIPFSSSVLKNNLTNWNKNYLLHEKFENWLITSGSEIYKNVFIGNVIDYNNAISNNKLKEKKHNILKQLNDRNLSEEAQMKFRGRLLDIDSKLENNYKNNDYKVLINCKEGVEFPKLELISSIFEKSSKLLQKDTDLIYLEFPSSGSFVLSSLTNNNMLSIINFLRLINYLSVEKNHKILIYCYDGFTHLSMLSLLLEIYTNFNNLNNAILKYYLIYEKYLYWFKIDYEILNFLQNFLLYFSPSNPAKPAIGASNSAIKSLDYPTIKQWYDTAYMSIYNMNSFQFLKVYESDKALLTKKNHSVYGDLQKLDKSVISELQNEKDDWFDLKNDNNLPSKILPYLYLGGIVHSNSETLLRLLDINYVITIGEKPAWLNLMRFDNQFSLNYENLDPFLKTKLKKDDIIEIDNPSPYIKKVIYLPNIQDNGIDPFEPYLLYLLKQIRKIRDENKVQADEKAWKPREHEVGQAGTNSKSETIKNRILVNCKVGVSRSASLCTAEVMNFLKISLPRAYLYVRVRRLNLIIQPNLKIFYNLLELEEILTIKENIKIKYINEKIVEYNQKIKLKRDKKEEIPKRKLKVLREVDWHILCKEIDILNSHYIKNY